MYHGMILIQTKVESIQLAGVQIFTRKLAQQI